jgi:hypothetical protein
MANLQSDGITWYTVSNTGNVAIPPNSLVFVTGINSDKIVVSQCTSSSATAGVLVTGPVSIPPNSFGQAHDQFPCAVAYDPSTGTPSSGQTWGCLAGSWLLSYGQSGFFVCGGANAASGLVVVMPQPPSGGGGNQQVAYTNTQESGTYPNFSATSITTQTVDGTTGLYQTSDGTLGMLLATRTVAGAVSKVAQSFAGTKQFDEIVVLNPLNPSYPVYIQTSNTAAAAYLYFSTTNNTNPPGNATLYAGTYYLTSPTAGAFFDAVTYTLSDSSTTNAFYASLGFDLVCVQDISVSRFRIGGEGGAASNPPVYSIFSSGGSTLDGQYGTDPSGNTISGGIITDIGTGPGIGQALAGIFFTYGSSSSVTTGQCYLASGTSLYMYLTDRNGIGLTNTLARLASNFATMTFIISNGTSYCYFKGTVVATAGSVVQWTITELSAAPSFSAGQNITIGW